MHDHGQASDAMRPPELAPGKQVSVRKLNSVGAQVTSYAAIIAQVWPTGARLDASWTRDTMALGYTTFERGDHFLEWFFTDRWYNIMEVRGVGESLKGWYCNVSYPAEFEADRISYRDLALDLWVTPDGNLITLDEDEFAADLAIGDDARGKALDALDHLRALVARHATPFDRLP